MSERRDMQLLLLTVLGVATKTALAGMIWQGYDEFYMHALMCFAGVASLTAFLSLTKRRREILQERALRASLDGPSAWNWPMVWVAAKAALGCMLFGFVLTGYNITAAGLAAASAYVLLDGDPQQGSFQQLLLNHLQALLFSALIVANACYWLYQLSPGIVEVLVRKFSSGVIMVDFEFATTLFLLASAMRSYFRICDRTSERRP